MDWIYEGQQLLIVVVAIGSYNCFEPLVRRKVRNKWLRYLISFILTLIITFIAVIIYRIVFGLGLSASPA